MKLFIGPCIIDPNAQQDCRGQLETKGATYLSDLRVITASYMKKRGNCLAGVTFIETHIHKCLSSKKYFHPFISEGKSNMKFNQKPCCLYAGQA